MKLSDHKHGFQRTQLLKNLESLPKLPSDTKMIDILNDKVQVPSDETTYWCRLHLLPEQLKNKHHIIEYEAVIQEGNEALVN
jgi:dopamine beta-monooxygenase